MESLTLLLNEHGIPETEEGLRSLFEAAWAEELTVYRDLAEAARWVLDAWLLGNLSRRNGMEAMEAALKRAGF